VRSDFPARDLRQFIAHARAKSGSLTAAYGTAGSMVSIAKLKSRGGFSTVDIPYKGSNLAVADVLAGHVEFTFADFAVASGQIKGGRVRGLAVTSATRSPLAPDLPSVAEELPGSETIVWYGLVAPAGTPLEIVDKLYQVTSKIMARKDVRTRFETAGLSVAPLSPDQFSGFIRSEITKWGIEVKEAGIQAQ
jgi:tripartite-type tricarboxylate transporter receptor subunit TctC